MIKISIIIPVHNSSEYLRKCLDSCVKQTLEDIEIIPVDDCSNDDSPLILREYKEKYPLVVKPIFLEKNIRQGGARNVGIRVAQGEYIAFVDSDDWIDTKMCETLYNEAQGVDFAGGGASLLTV